MWTPLSKLSDVVAGRVPVAVRAALLFVLLAVSLGWLARDVIRPCIHGDGVGYYAPLASVVFQHDLDLRDELLQVSPQLLQAMYITPDGRFVDPFPVGSALLWTPAVLLVRRLPPSHALDAPLAIRVRTPHPGWAPRFARTLLWTNVLLVLLAGASLAGTLARETGVVAAAAGTAAAIFGTPVFFYALADPGYSHAPTFFAVCMLLVLALGGVRHRPLALLGAAWGFVSLVRPQDAILGLLFAPRLLEEWHHRTSARSRARLLLEFALPAFLVFSPQMIFWQRIYGQPLVSPAADFLPLWKAQILPLLFSTWNGALLWSPLLLLGLVGSRKLGDAHLRRWMLVAIVLEILVCALVLDWWGGRSFGPRRLVSVVPFAALGMAMQLQRVRGSKVLAALLAAVLILGCTWSVRLARYHLAGLLPANPGSFADYQRHYGPGSPHAQLYGYWDYPRFFSEIVISERMLRIDARRRAAEVPP